MLHAAHLSFISTHTTDPTALPLCPPQLYKLVALLVSLNICLKVTHIQLKCFLVTASNVSTFKYSVVTLAIKKADGVRWIISKSMKQT